MNNIKRLLAVILVAALCVAWSRGAPALAQTDAPPETATVTTEITATGVTADAAPAGSLDAATSLDPAAAVGRTMYLPIATRLAGGQAAGRTVNVPFFDTAVLTDTPVIEQMSIFWFGKITPSDNYVDVRVAYNNTEISFYIAVIDRLLYFDDSPSTNELTQWDGLSLYLHRGALDAGKPTPESYRLDMQWGAQPHRRGFLAAFRGDGSSWTPADVPFVPFTTYRGDRGPNSGSDIRGWAAIYSIPFASLGTQRPPDGASWRLAVTNHDRDAQAGGMTRGTWPEVIDATSPSTWGLARFGLPAYAPPNSSAGGSVVIWNGLNGAKVNDGNVGGYAHCGGDPSTFWTQWGIRPWSFYNPEISDFNVQNQVDIADWPCFARYYVAFPLDQVPKGKVVRSAKLTLFQFGGSDPQNAPRSLIQIFTVDRDWDRASVNWNNGPMAVENVSRAWVDPIKQRVPAPLPREWDVSYAVAQAYQKGVPLRLAVYSADRDYHTGKYFIASSAWNGPTRPTLTIEWGNP